MNILIMHYMWLWLYLACNYDYTALQVHYKYVHNSLQMDALSKVLYLCHLL